MVHLWWKKFLAQNRHITTTAVGLTVITVLLVLLTGFFLVNFDSAFFTKYRLALSVNANGSGDNISMALLAISPRPRCFLCVRLGFLE